MVLILRKTLLLIVWYFNCIKKIIYICESQNSDRFDDMKNISNS